jgi:hypothetical protein
LASTLARNSVCKLAGNTVSRAPSAPANEP